MNEWMNEWMNEGECIDWLTWSSPSQSETEPTYRLNRPTRLFRLFFLSSLVVRYTYTLYSVLLTLKRRNKKSPEWIDRTIETFCLFHGSIDFPIRPRLLPCWLTDWLTDLYLIPAFPLPAYFFLSFFLSSSSSSSIPAPTAKLLFLPRQQETDSSFY